MRQTTFGDLKPGDKFTVDLTKSMYPDDAGKMFAVNAVGQYMWPRQSAPVTKVEPKVAHKVEHKDHQFLEDNIRSLHCQVVALRAKLNEQAEQKNLTDYPVLWQAIGFVEESVRVLYQQVAELRTKIDAKEKEEGRGTNQSAVKRQSYAYDEVRGLLCDLCKAGVPDYLQSTMDEPVYKHGFNGQSVPCTASDFRVKATKAAMRMPAGEGVNTPGDTNE